MGDIRTYQWRRRQSALSAGHVPDGSDRNGKPYSMAEDLHLERRINDGAALKVIARELGRTTRSVEQRLQHMPPCNPALVPKKRNCMCCKREFWDEIYRLCDECRVKDAGADYSLSLDGAR